MRPPSRFITPTLFTALLSLTFASAASAGSVDTAVGSEPAALEDTTLVDLDVTFDATTAHMDAQLELAYSSSTTMDCTQDAELGLETCIVHGEPLSTAETAPLAAN